MRRTSQSHPLRIDSLDISDEAHTGGIGLTFCPGKTSESLHGAPWDRDLRTDLDAIANWGADMVVTLLEPQEFSMLGVADFPDAAKSLFAWVHAPVPDVDVPGPAFEAVWADVSFRLHKVLTQGGKVLVHCRGGLGRAGLVAALILIERGHPAREAIEKIRRTRPGAIETSAQEDWLIGHDQDARRKPALRLASLLGGAMGDSLGSEIEFLPLSKIRSTMPEGLVDLPEHGHAAAPVTDDTQMTLFTMEGLLHAERSRSDPIACVHRALLRWLVTQSENPQIPIDLDAGLIMDRRLWRRKAPGMTCLSSLRAAWDLGVPANNDSKGCGTIMRVAPIALMCARKNVHDLACATSALTHGHVTGQLAAAAWAGMLADVATGQPLEAAAEAAMDQLDGVHGGTETYRAIRAALNAPRDAHPETVESLGGGWVAEEALSIALYSCLAGGGFERGLQCAALHSGDSDSTAAIAGNMLGLLYPEEALQHRWAKVIQFREHFGKMGQEFAELLAMKSAERRGSM